jgi:hypothetical protein
MAVNFSSIISKATLLAELRAIDISVPLRTEGRKTHHAETWTICRLLSTLADSECLDYPLSLEHRDRPDFLLSSGKTEIGIEVTEAVSEQYAAFSALAEREFPDTFLDPGHFRWGAKKITVEEMRALLRQSQLTAPPWCGDRPEREWASYIESVIESKLKKLVNPQFGRFNENWLAIYDNLSLPNVDLEKAINFLLPALVSRWSRIPSFTSIFVEHGPVVAKLSPMETRHLVLHNLW